MRLSENHGLVYVLKPGDHQAGVDGDSFSMKNFRHFCIDLLTAVLAAAVVLVVVVGERGKEVVITAEREKSGTHFHYIYAIA